VLAPDYVDALVNLGATYRAQGELDQAVSCYRRALELTPDLPTAHSNLGNALGQQGRLEDAESCLRRALELKPDFAEAHSNLGGVLRNQNRPEEAMAFLQKALLLRPDFTEAHVHLAITLIAMGQPDEAERSYLRALRLRPDSTELKFGLSCVKLLLGDYESGFALYESRLEKDALPQAVYGALQVRMDEVRGVPRWQGEPGAGRTLLVWTDQGLGDTLMMMRYFPMLKGRGFDRLVVHVEDALVRIVQNLPGIDEVVSRSRSSPAARVDCHCPLTSLPLLFKTRVETIPGKVPYSTIPEALRRKWADRVGAVKQPRVGLVWAGRSDYPKDALRSVRLEKFSPLFEVPGINFVNLQKGREAGQIGETRFALVDFMDGCTDMLETGALVEQLDLVICVDTAVMHLAGALGKPLWLLNRFETEWRWMLDREHSPWYPTMRIFRQRRPDDWDEVMARVSSALSLQFGTGWQGG
jgi:Flp pilus assembly protein TadD